MTGKETDGRTETNLSRSMTTTQPCLAFPSSPEGQVSARLSTVSPHCGRRSQLQLPLRCSYANAVASQVTCSFLWKLARRCKVLQPIAKCEAAKWAWFLSQCSIIFKFGVTSFITSFLDDLWPSAVVENRNARKESGLALASILVIIFCKQ